LSVSSTANSLRERLAQKNAAARTFLSRPSNAQLCTVKEQSRRLTILDKGGMAVNYSL
jgi:hypothetical protein